MIHILLGLETLIFITAFNKQTNKRYEEEKIIKKQTFLADDSEVYGIIQWAFNIFFLFSSWELIEQIKGFTLQSQFFTFCIPLNYYYHKFFLFMIVPSIGQTTKKKQMWNDKSLKWLLISGDQRSKYVFCTVYH